MNPRATQPTGPDPRRRWTRGILLLGVLLLAAFGTLPGCGGGADQKPVGQRKLIIGTDTTLIPMSFMTDDREIIGFEPDLIEEISKIVGFDYEMVPVQWAGLLGGVITGKFDMAIASVTILDERKKRMAFSIPYLKSGVALVVRKEMEGVESVQDMQERGLLVGAQVGTTAYFYIERFPELRKKGYQAYGHAITDLIKGVVDGVVGESTATLYYKNQQKDYFQKIKMVGEILTEEHYGIVMRPEDTELRKQVNDALRQLHQDGTLQRLHDKWDLGRSAGVPEWSEISES